jgi:nicotinamidase/pyrazinamidase
MKALIVVDAQYDFFVVSKEDYENGKGGALAVPDSPGIIPVINALLPKFDLIIFTKDWHPKNMDAFASNHKGKKPFDTYINKDGVEDTLWPNHCVNNTRGADLHDDIDLKLIKGNFYIFKKGTKKSEHPYSGFGAEGLADFLKERGVTETIIVGLATDYCVRDTVLDSIKEGFNTTVIWDGCRGIADDLTPTLNEFFDAGANVIDLEMYNEKN